MLAVGGTAVVEGTVVGGGVVVGRGSVVFVSVMSVAQAEFSSPEFKGRM